VVEAVERALVQAGAERVGQRHRLVGADLHLALAQLVEELDEHGL
jgi:hypothetical protein